MLALLTPLIILPPTLLYMWMVQRVDRFEKEPFSHLLFAFFWGCIPAVIFSVIFSLLLGAPIEAYYGAESLQAEFWTSAGVAPLIEELFKGLGVFLVYRLRRKEFDGWVDGLVYGATVGFGFAYVENILYLAGADDWFSLFITRVLILGFMHGFYTSFIGIGFGLARYARGNRRWLFPLLGLLAAILAHALHNGSLSYAEQTEGLSLLGTIGNYLMLIVLSFGLSRVALFAERSLFKRFLIDEAGASITPAQYAALCGKPPAGTRPPSKALRQAAAELAQKKRQALFENAPGQFEHVGRLRDALMRLAAPPQA